MEYYVFCAILLIFFLYGMRIQKSDGSQIEMLERFNNLRGGFCAAYCNRSLQYAL